LRAGTLSAKDDPCRSRRDANSSTSPAPT
jgi:hypothetical protein